MVIDVAFCLDGNLARHLCVVVSSLIKSKKSTQLHYRIFCICTSDVLGIKETVTDIVQSIDNESEIRFIVTDNTYESAYEIRGISAATYMRFMIPDLLPDVDKIIYMDVDYVVNGDFAELWELEMEDACFAGVKAEVNTDAEWDYKIRNFPYWTLLDGWKGNYINAGILIMNLEEIRRRNLVPVWNQLSGMKFYYQDQDIINISCQGYSVYYDENSGCIRKKSMIKFLPVKYNAMTFMDWVKYQALLEEHIYTEEDVKEATENPVGIHFAGKKPWKDASVRFAFLWWKYVLEDARLVRLFEEELILSIKEAGSMNLNPRTMMKNNSKAALAEKKAKRNNVNFRLMTDWMGLIQQKESIAGYCKKKNWRRIGIYGMHYIGELLYHELTAHGVKVAYGIDQTITSVEMPVKVYQPVDKLPEADAIIVTPVFWYLDIKNTLMGQTDCEIVSMREILDEIRQDRNGKTVWRNEENRESV